MHIAEGVLSPAVLGAGFLVAGIGTALGLRRAAFDRIILCGVFAAVFFLASLIHVPIGFSSAHLIATGLTGIFLGIQAFPAILCALVLQAVFFQYGGITVLGVNTATMASAAVLAGLTFHTLHAAFPSQKGCFAAGFVAGILGVFAAALFTACALAFSEEGFMTAACALFIAHIPIMLVEGLITACTVSYLAKVRPHLLQPQKLSSKQLSE